MVPHLGT